MTVIKSECRDNAVGMLQGKHSLFLGWIGNIRYYVVDGKVWSHDLEGEVCRCDDDEEGAQIRKVVSKLNK